MKKKTLSVEERERIAAQYGVAVPKGVKVQVVPSGRGVEFGKDRSWAEGVQRRGRIYARNKKFKAYNAKSGGGEPDDH